VNGVDCPPMPLFVIVAKPALLEPVKEVNPRPALEALFEMVELEAVLESAKLTPAEFTLGTTLTPVNEMICALPALLVPRKLASPVLISILASAAVLEPRKVTTEL
jgi:hypothetical protein